jgi:hypothetical protein
MPQNMYNLLIQDVLINREKYGNAYKSQPKLSLSCKYVLTSRILHVVTYFVDLAAEMYQSDSLRIAL